MRLFHYTNKSGYQGIVSKGVIQSGGGNYGTGVYLTDLNPDLYERSTIARAIFRLGGSFNEKKGKLDFYVEIEIPDGKVKEHRDHVFIYPSNQLSLQEYKVHSQGDFESWTKVANAAVAVAGVVMIGKAIAESDLPQKVWNAWTSYGDSCQKACTVRMKAWERTVHETTQRQNLTYYSVQPKDNGICVFCEKCSRKISSTYSGGYFEICPPCNIETHEKEEHSGLLAFVIRILVVILAVVAILWIPKFLTLPVILAVVAIYCGYQ